MKIVKGNSEIEDTFDKIHEDCKGNITCCGGKWTCNVHIFGTSYSQWGYQCECGNLINCCTKKDFPLW